MPRDEEWLAQLPQEQTTAAPPNGVPDTPIGQQPPVNEYAGQVAEVHSGKTVYKLPYSAEFAFPQKGKPVTMPIGKLVNAYGMHLAVQPKYDELLKKHNSLMPEYETLKSKSERFAELEKLQEWTEQNPEIFQKLWDSFTNKEKIELQQKLGTPEGQQSPQGINQQLVDTLAEMRKKLDASDQRWSSWEKQQQEQETEKNVALIENEIQEFKKNYPFIDIDTPGDDGITLAEKIIKHGLDRKYPTFKVAALEYLEPQLLEKFKDQGRSEAVKTVRDNTKQGIIATSNTPFSLNGQSAQPADAKKPDHVLLQEAKSMFEQLKQETTT